jgi:hypothetical protein
VKGTTDETVIYVKKPPSFSEPKPRWDKTTYGSHELSEIKALAQQLVMGLMMTSFLHFKMGIKQSILMQACMMPLTFMDCKVVHRYFLGKGDKGERVYDELLEGEEKPKEEGEEGDEAIEEEEEEEEEKKSIDDASNKSSTKKSAPSSTRKKTNSTAASGGADFATLKRLIQGTWDSGKSAKYDSLMKALTPANVDTKTESE